jgi:hypothetical protein
MEVPLALSNLAARDKVGRPISTSRAICRWRRPADRSGRKAGMTKQAMADLVTQCEAWGLVTRERPA